MNLIDLELATVVESKLWWLYTEKPFHQYKKWWLKSFSGSSEDRVRWADKGTNISREIIILASKTLNELSQ